jgi:hypothetical protein
MSLKQAALAALTTLTLGASTLSSAALVDLSATQTQTSNAQVLTFTFTGLSPSAGAGGLFSMHVLGDYDLASEVLPSVKIDGMTVATDLGPALGNVTLISQSLYYSEWSFTLGIPELDLSHYLADGTLSVEVAIGANSGVFAPGTDTGYVEDPYVSVALRYDDVAASAVPEPRAAALVLLAALGAGATRRRRRREG